MNTNITDYIDKSSKDNINTRKIYYEKAFQLINEWLMENDILCFGGYALNELLPEKSKIYKSSDIYDIDCYSYKPISHSKKLIVKLKNNGYFYNQVYKGLNNNVYKINVDFVNIVDISFMPKKTFDKLYEISKYDYAKNNAFNKGIKYIPIGFLMYSFNREFSSPSADFRWAKVHSRFLIFKKGYIDNGDGLYIKKNNKKVHKNEKNMDGVQPIVDNIMAYIKDRAFPITGARAVHMFTNGDVSYSNVHTNPCISIYADNPLEVFEDIKTRNPDTVFLKKRTAAIVPTYVDNYLQIFIKHGGANIEILRILDNSSFCFSTVKKRGYVLNTVSGILACLYAQYIFEFSTTCDNTEFVNFILKFEKWVLKNNVSTSDFMNMKCYGKAKRYLSLKKDNWMNMDTDLIKTYPE